LLQRFLDNLDVLVRSLFYHLLFQLTIDFERVC
jgi:hypothetical protein